MTHIKNWSVTSLKAFTLRITDRVLCTGSEIETAASFRKCLGQHREFGRSRHKQGSSRSILRGLVALCGWSRSSKSQRHETSDPVCSKSSPMQAILSCADGLFCWLLQCGGTLICRADLVKKEICTSRIFMNCVAFLKIPLEESLEEEPEYDILDSTRIHCEDYHIARKMAADAEEMDEEDLEDMTHPSGAVAQLMENGAGKLDDLSLDDFAAALAATQQLQKRLTLYMIRDELQNPYSERRGDFLLPTDPEIFTMLTGETRQTLNLGLIIPVVIVRILSDGRLICRLDSGIEGIVKQGFFEDGVPYRVGSTAQAQVISLSMVFNQTGEAQADSMSVELSMLQSSISADDSERRKVPMDHYYDTTQMAMDKQAVEAKNKKTQGRVRRVVNHPNFHNFNAGQAELYLANMQRGDCVVRPSSRGNDHLAVTWKVDDGVYQHIGKLRIRVENPSCDGQLFTNSFLSLADVLELDKPNEYSLGRNLRIQGKYTYSDLDELIVSHIRSMARKVDEMMRSDKYKGTDAELRKPYLTLFPGGIADMFVEL
jgi:transcription elongation factor SPT6